MVRPISKFQLISILRLQVIHDYVHSNSRRRDFTWKLLLFHTKIIFA